MSDFTHSSESNEHYTPPEIVEAAREVLGRIDLDPFSCALANEVVRATHYFAANGLHYPWVVPDGPTYDVTVPARVLCNPPGGKLDKKLEKVAAGPGLSSASMGWAKLVYEYEIGNVHSAIFIGFNLEVLRMTQEHAGYGLPSCLDFPFCVPRERLRFWNESTAPEDRGVKGAPQYPNVIVFVPPKGNRIMPGFFRDKFSKFGKVVGV